MTQIAVHLVVNDPDADAASDRAIAAGATAFEPPQHVPADELAAYVAAMFA